MADRLTSLRRIEAVQKQMVRLSDWRLALAEQACRDLASESECLRGYIVGEGALGVPLAKAALKSLDAVHTRREAAIKARDAEIGRRDALMRRETTVARMAEAAALDARRAADDRDLRATMEAWIAARDASLP